MKAIGSVFKAPLKMLGLIKSPGKAPVPLPTASRDSLAQSDQQLDELRRRRGGAVDMLTGAAGAEAGATGKVSLG